MSSRTVDRRRSGWLLQPIVELATGLRPGAEALSRFPAEWNRPPDVCFADAHLIGVGDELEARAGVRIGRSNG
jgi:hypothetical protein